MYEKNLTEDFRLRLNKTDMDFLRSLSEERNTSVSEVIRSIIGDYRRSLDTLKLFKDALEVVKEKEIAVHGNTTTDINNQL